MRIQNFFKKKSDIYCTFLLKNLCRPRLHLQKAALAAAAQDRSDDVEEEEEDEDRSPEELAKALRRAQLMRRIKTQLQGLILAKGSSDKGEQVEGEHKKVGNTDKTFVESEQGFFYSLTGIERGLGTIQLRRNYLNNNNN